MGSDRLAAMTAHEAAERADKTLAPGLYLVGTPIGNLEDITLRALRVLKEADLIACEDTRQTQKLLNHYGISTRTISYHEHNEMTRAPELVLDLERGARVALVKEAIEDVVEVLGGNRHIVIAREVTKIHEEFLRGRASEVLQILNARSEVKGEITLLIGKAEETEQKATERVTVRERIQRIMSEERTDEEAALRKVAKELGISKSEAYRELQRSK